jgi:superfamily II DNA or RNA helicase
MRQIDVEAVREGYSERAKVEKAIVNEIDELTLRAEWNASIRFLSVLVRDGVLDIRLAFRPMERGIFHDKVGVFKDDQGNTVSFLGSANETLAAWDWRANHESFEVFRSWEGPSEAERTERHASGFDSIWSMRSPELEVIDFPSVAKEKLVLLAGDLSLEAAEIAVQEALRSRNGSNGRDTGQRLLQSHQADALLGWSNRGNRGIIDHATGAGKTLTALHAIKSWIESGRPALVLVPSELLLKQWVSEIERELPTGSYSMLLAGAGASRARWKSTLRDFTRDLPELGARIVISTMDTAAKEEFRERIVAGAHLLIVADEVHRIGAPSRRCLTAIQCGAALGLSATPDRYGDPLGTREIHNQFGEILPPPFGIPDAIAAGRLVPYDYFVHEVTLTEPEARDWRDLTSKIRHEVARAGPPTTNLSEISNRLKSLLHKRARIAKGAINKIATALEIIRTEYREGDHWLVYCDDTTQLHEVSATVRALGIPIFTYFADMEDSHEDTLGLFQQNGGLLVAIRCLDEGIDMPLINRALVLASSRNRREFIQRRGRVLRTRPGKYFAAIHDVLVLGEAGTATEDTSGLARAELARAKEFASNARNASVQMRLRELEVRYSIGLTDWAARHHEYEGNGDNDD